MSRDWKPGDVAMISTPLDFDAVAIRSGVPSNMGWAYTGSDGKYGNCWTSDVDGKRALRPLVVIDPEDESTLRQIGDLLVAADRGYDDESWQDLQAALREFANPTPPRPDEPQGLGAVVEDTDGRRFVRYDQGAGWHWLDGTASRQWNDVAAVRVLSRGYTEDGA